MKKVLLAVIAGLLMVPSVGFADGWKGRYSPSYAYHYRPYCYHRYHDYTYRYHRHHRHRDHLYFYNRYYPYRYDRHSYQPYSHGYGYRR